jgi:16S rRNA (uracil1498-N3)-methyltransferase
MQRFFTEPSNVRDDEIIIYGGDVNHMKNALRMKIGEQLEVCDSGGKVYLCRIKEYRQGENYAGKSFTECKNAQNTESAESTKNNEKAVKVEKPNKIDKTRNTDRTKNIDKLTAVLKIEKEWLNDTELPSRIYLFQGLPKSDKMELIIQKAVELGVYEIIPVVTNRVVVKMDEKKSAKKVERWNNISESAAKQSARGIIPKVNAVMTYSEALNYSRDLDIRLLPYELAEGLGNTREILRSLKPNQKLGVFIGPEGGFDKEEVEKAMEVGVNPITLGKRILRTETAAITMLSILMMELS